MGILYSCRSPRIDIFYLALMHMLRYSGCCRRKMIIIKGHVEQVVLRPLHIGAYSIRIKRELFFSIKLSSQCTIASFSQLNRPKINHSPGTFIHLNTKFTFYADCSIPQNELHQAYLFTFTVRLSIRQYYISCLFSHFTFPS